MRPSLRLTTLFLFAMVTLGGCAGRMVPPALMEKTPPPAGTFVMRDGVRLPYREWLPSSGEPWAVVLALHGMNDSRDAWEIPAPEMAKAGIAVFAPDQRGFGDTSTRGLWPSEQALVSDADTMARKLRARYPHAKLILMGESMGAAVLMCLATDHHPPPADGYVLVAPAVWGRAEMNVFLRSTLWLASNLVPGMELSGAPLKVTASSNRAALIRLSRDPLTLRSTRVDAVKGLVDLMDAALASAPHFNAPALFLYGGKDELVPDQATAATWQALRPGERRAFYPEGYHLLLRDLDREKPIGDVIAWIRDPKAPLPSGSETAAATWLARQD
ncbi:MAG: lysophospholipase [Alphaproteobacteria bacterium]|nr:lysophospholipase [Alphaproteobacteria bacterium]